MTFSKHNKATTTTTKTKITEYLVHYFEFERKKSEEERSMKNFLYLKFT